MKYNITMYYGFTLILRYIAALNQEVRFLWQKPKKTWGPSDIQYDAVRVGVNTLATFVSRMAKRANTKHYTNHCLRVTGILYTTYHQIYYIMHRKIEHIKIV